VLLACCGDMPGIWLWDPRTGKHLRTLGDHTFLSGLGPVRNMCYLQLDGEEFVAALQTTRLNEINLNHPRRLVYGDRVQLWPTRAEEEPTSS
jgi:hypothetical protein